MYDAVLANGCSDAVWTIDLACAAGSLHYHTTLFTTQVGFNQGYAAHPFYESQTGGWVIIIIIIIIITGQQPISLIRR